MSEEGYTTIFHPEKEGVTIHKPRTVSIAMMESPILQGCKPKGVTLWMILADGTMKKEQANNVYNLPSISQTIQYLNTAAGFSVKEMWIKVIKSGKYNTWPAITPSTVQHHFPESDQTQKGHMKRQHQGVRTDPTRDPKCNRPNVVGKYQDYCSKQCVNIL